MPSGMPAIEWQIASAWACLSLASAGNAGTTPAATRGESCPKCQPYKLIPALAVLAIPLAAAAADPIKIGVIAENSAISGIAIPNGAQIAADEINAKGGIDGRQIEIVAL